jgi:hypothetical protein
MWYIILGYLIVSALFAILFWLILIASKRKDEEHPVESPDESEKQAIDETTDDLLVINVTSPDQLPK